MEPLATRLLQGHNSISSDNNRGTFTTATHCIAAYFVNINGEPIRDNGSATGETAVQ